jgi:hypothetical protein
MPRPKKAPTTKVDVAEFVNDELEVLSTVLTNRAKRQVARPEIVGALVLAASQLPLEVVEALFPAYGERARKVIPKDAGDTARPS